MALLKIFHAILEADPQNFRAIFMGHPGTFHAILEAILEVHPQIFRAILDGLLKIFRAMLEALLKISHAIPNGNQPKFQAMLD